MESGPSDGSTPATPRPTAQRVAAAVTIVVLVLGYPVGIIIYSVGDDGTKSFVGALMAIMTGAVVVSWFYTRARRPGPGSVSERS